MRREIGEKSVEQVWIEDMIDKGLTIDQQIVILKAEAEETTDEEEFVWLNESIARLEMMKHS